MMNLLFSNEKFPCIYISCGNVKDGVMFPNDGVQYSYKAGKDGVERLIPKHKSNLRTIEECLADYDNFKKDLFNTIKTKLKNVIINEKFHLDAIDK